MVEYIIIAISISAIFLFGCVGEIISEKSGQLNLGTPGIMCLGAAGGYFGVVLYVNIMGSKNIQLILLLLIAVLCSSLFSLLGGLIYSFLTVTLKSNQNVTGLALTIFAGGFAQFFVQKVKIAGISKALSALANSFLIPQNSESPFLKLFFSYGILIYIAIAVAIVASFMLNKTKVGLSLRAVGENPATADAVGINVTKYKYGAILIGAIISGLGGLTYISVIGTFDQSASIQSIGWLAVALVIFTVWKPNISILGSFVFGLLFIAQEKLVLLFPSISRQLAQLTSLLPYVVTVIVLIITSITGSKENQPPASLGLNYFREER